MKNLSRGLLIVKKFSPEILTGIGVVSMLASTVLASKATLKVESIISERDTNLNKVETEVAKGDREKYTEQDEKKDTLLIHTKSIANLAKAYAPAIITGTIGVTCILSGFGIIKKRNIALAGAYKIVSDSFAKYRGNVIAKYGKDVDIALKNGTIMTKVDKLNKNGKVIGEEEVEIVDPNGYSMYAKMFDESNRNWDKAPGYNKMFLQGQQNYCNDLLKLRGHLFLNEVYQMLDIPHTKEGALVGWVNDGDGDSFIDFGLFDSESAEAGHFVNEKERSIILDFNVDGVIYDLI